MELESLLEPAIKVLLVIAGFLAVLIAVFGGWGFLAKCTTDFALWRLARRGKSFRSAAKADYDAHKRQK